MQTNCVSSLLQEYARQLGACLLKLADPTSDHSALQKRVDQLVPEFGSLMHSLALSNPDNLKWCHAGKMDGSSDQTPHPAKFWADLLVQNLLRLKQCMHAYDLVQGSTRSFHKSSFPPQVKNFVAGKAAVKILLWAF